MDDNHGVANERQEPPGAPLSVARIAGELLAGGVGAMIGVAPLVQVDRDSEWGLGYVLMLFWTYPIGALVSCAGVYFVGNVGRQAGSFRAALAGAALGGAIALTVTIGAVPGDYSIADEALFAIAFGAPTVGAVIGYNLTRRHTLRPAGAAEPPSAVGEKPPPGAARIAIQFLAGAAAAFVPLGLALVCPAILEFLSMLTTLHPFFLLVPTLYLSFTGPLLCAIAVYVVGRIGNQTGSLGAVFGGAVLAVLIRIPVAFVSPHLRILSPYDLPLLVSLGATLGFHLTRKPKSPSASARRPTP
jgi:hypothetical protein